MSPACAVDRPELVDYACGGLPAKRRRELEEHVRQCECCQADVHRVEEDLRGLSDPDPEASLATIQQDVDAAFHVAARERTAVPTRRLWVGALAATAALAAAAALAIMWLSARSSATGAPIEAAAAVQDAGSAPAETAVDLFAEGSVRRTAVESQPAAQGPTPEEIRAKVEAGDLSEARTMLVEARTMLVDSTAQTRHDRLLRAELAVIEAEAMVAGRYYVAACDAYLAVAREFPKTEQGERSLFVAAQLALSHAKIRHDALVLLERYLERYPSGLHREDAVKLQQTLPAK